MVIFLGSNGQCITKLKAIKSKLPVKIKRDTLISLFVISESECKYLN